MKKIILGAFLLSTLAFGNYDGAKLHHSLKIGVVQSNGANLEKTLQTVDMSSGTTICQVVFAGDDNYQIIFKVIGDLDDVEEIKERVEESKTEE